MNRHIVKVTDQAMLSAIKEWLSKDSPSYIQDGIKNCEIKSVEYNPEICVTNIILSSPDFRPSPEGAIPNHSYITP